MKGCVFISTEILLGWLSLLCFIFSCSYSFIKRKSKFRSKNKMWLKNLLNYHCYIAVMATILAFVHAGKNLTDFKLSTGYIALILMILITLIGILMKYFKKIYIKHRTVLLYTHIILTILLVGILILHIGNYLLMQFLI